MTNFSIKLEGLGQAPAVRDLWLLAVDNFSSNKLPGLTFKPPLDAQRGM
jgi:hypothetical protein